MRPLGPTLPCGQECPTGAKCADHTSVASLEISKDYWRNSDITVYVYECAEFSCKGGVNATGDDNADPYCRTGHTGVLCGVVSCFSRPLWLPIFSSHFPSLGDPPSRLTRSLLALPQTRQNSACRGTSSRAENASPARAAPTGPRHTPSRCH